jgi:hypothetical protein
MQWELVVALVIAVPIILFPVALIWYMNIGGIFTAAREVKLARKKKPETVKIDVE